MANIVNSESQHLLASLAMPLIGPELLSEIVATASDLCVVVSSEGRVIGLTLNPFFRSFGHLGHWVGKQISDIITKELFEKFNRRLIELRRPGATALPLEINHVDDQVWEFSIRYAMHSVGVDDAVLMLGRDLRPIAEMQQQLVQAQIALKRDCESQREMDTRYRVLMAATRDAVVLVAMSNGRISDLNAAAAVMRGGSRQDLIGAAIAQEFEGRRRGGHKSGCG